MKRVIDLSKIDKILDDPAMQDSFELARAFGATTRQHFRGRERNPFVVIEAAVTAIQVALRDIAEEDRAATIQEDVVDRLAMALEFINGIGRPTEGEA